MDLVAMWQQMGLVAKAVAFVLFFMSMWSFGVAIERIFTFTQARNQSKLFAPQVAKHLKEGRLKDARPVYPAIAQSARVQGVVIIEATIGPNGAVQEAKVLRSIPLLDQAALDAVRQWQFTPTLLNGVPVPVIMTVTVNFTLQ